MCRQSSLDHLLAGATGCGNAWQWIVPIWVRLALRETRCWTVCYCQFGCGGCYEGSNGTCPLTPFPLSSSSSAGTGSSNSIDIDNDFESAFYIRISFQDGLGIIRSVGDLAESQGVSIHSILQQPITDRMAADTVVTTESCKYSQVKALCELIEKEDFALSAPVFMPMISDY